MPPTKVSEIACTLKITGSNLKPAPVEAAPAAVVLPDAQGNLALLPDTAETHGTLKEEAQGGQPNIGFWDNWQDYLSWKVNFKQAGAFKVTASCATVHAQSRFVVEVAGQKLEGTAPQTGAWDKFTTVEVGVLEIKPPGEQLVNVRPKDAQAWKAINLRWVKFHKTE